MRVARLMIDGFRGFDTFELLPRSHVAIVAAPRSGRSDLVAALERVLHPDSTRWQLREWDFHEGNVDRSIQIEVTLVGLDVGLRQRFLRSLEVWDQEDSVIVEEADDPTDLDGEQFMPALRLRYVAAWDSSEERSEQRLEYAKSPSGQTTRVDRVSRDDRLALPFRSIRQREPLAIRSEGDFRRMLEGSTNADDVLDALRRLAEGVETLSAELSAEPAIVEGLERVLESLREPLAVDRDVQDVIRFLPEGGAVSGLLRSLTAALDLGEGAGHLPIGRHGSTIRGLMSAAEALWWADVKDGVVAIDDFGDELDASSGARMAQLLIARVGQAWLSTRRAEVARSFRVEDVVRLTGTSGQRRAYQCDPPVDKNARGALRHYQLQLLPAMTAHGVIVCEGPHDVHAYRAVAERRESIDETTPAAAHRIELVDGGGKDLMWKVASFASQLGFATVGVMDWDKDNEEAARALERVDEAADAVVRLPLGFGVERLLLHDLSDADIRSAIESLATSFPLSLPSGFPDLNRQDLEKFATKHVLKNGAGGLHVAFIEALPQGVVPSRAAEAVTRAVDAILNGSNGVQQL